MFVLGLSTLVPPASANPTRRGPASVPHHPTRIKPGDPAGYDWQSMGRDNTHQAYENDPNMSNAVAPTLGVNWMTSILSQDVGGPTVAYNPILGETLVYTGDDRGNVSAYNEATGQTVWSTSIGAGDSIYSTPMVSGDQTSVWVGTVLNPHVWKLDATAGTQDCSVKTQLAIQMSPTEGMTATGTPMVYAASIDGPGGGGPELGIQESDCSVLFSSNPYQIPLTGSWASPAFGTDVNGRNLVFQGTADPDSAEYAIDATTGALDWEFRTGLVGDYDIGAAATVSPPGNNGFADGVVYFIDKRQILYALDLTTGALLWQNNFGATSGSPGGNARSAAALDGTTLVFGMANGVYAVNAVTGATLWHYTDPSAVEVISNPAIVGPPGQEVVAYGDLAGLFTVLNLADGSLLYSYQTGNYITASPSYVNGHFLIASTDGFLYDFAPGGGNASAPKTTIASPSQGATLPYSSTVTIQGTATDAVAVNAVQVAVQSGGSQGQWYNLATNSWQSGALTNLVPVDSPGSPSSTWSFTIPVAPNGASFQVFSNAVDAAQQADRTGAQVNFSVAHSGSAPFLTTTPVFIAPGAPFSATGSGFKPHEGVQFKVGGTLLGSVTASATGTVAANFTLPVKTVFGPTTVNATGHKSRAVGLAAIAVANDWQQAAGGPAHTAFEPNDKIFSHVISPGNNNYLQEAWYYTDLAPVESGPAIFQEQMFYGDDIGIVSAVQTDTAATLWSTTLPSGAAIRSTPAVDPVTDNLVLTADDGNLYVLSAQNGTMVGGATIGGIPTAPTLAAGTVYVGSDNATLASFNELTGGMNWSVTLGGAEHAIPSLDPAAGVLVSGDDSGAISAFSAANGGAPLWQITTGGPVTAAPAIVNGTVYVGSADGNLYAINESTGTVVWTYATGTPLTSGAVYDPNLQEVYVGGSSGEVFAVTASSGTLAWTTEPLDLPKNVKPGRYAGFGAATALLFGDSSSGSLIAWRSSQYGRFNSIHTTMQALTTAPTVNDGAVYVGANDGGVYAFTTTGGLPQNVPPAIRRAAQRQAPHASRRYAVPALPAAFNWTGRRDVPLHIDRIERARPAAALTFHGGPAQRALRSYAIFWTPPGTHFERRYIPAAVAALRQTGTFAQAVIDAGPRPPVFSDAAVESELARTVAAHHWTADGSTRFFVLTPPGSIRPSGFCSYHSAVALGQHGSNMAIYAVIPYGGAVAGCRTPAGFSRTGDPAIDNALAAIARSAREMSNDPLLNGWHAANGDEIGPGF